jgi:hypothetical protein
MKFVIKNEIRVMCRRLAVIQLTKMKCKKRENPRVNTAFENIPANNIK